MLRYRGKKITEVVQKLDSFPKMPEDYKQHSGIGGIVSIIMACLTFWLILSEVSYYNDYRIRNMFIPDTEFDTKLKINIDITVAVPCQALGADIVDVTSQEEQAFGSLTKEDTWFELSAEQQRHFDEVCRVNSYLREKYHSLRNIIWKTGYMSYPLNMPERRVKLTDPYNACRIYGQLELNKVAGNFHITIGYSVTVPGGHIHIPQYSHTNLSHRINQFSFGDPSPGIIHPLDGSSKIADKDYTYKYFLQVVPTDVDTSTVRIKTYQYSVKEQMVPKNFAHSHEIPGIFFKYDMNPLKVVIKEEEYSLFQLIVRICGCMGGLYIVFGIVKNIIEKMCNLVLQFCPQTTVTWGDKRGI